MRFPTTVPLFLAALAATTSLSAPPAGHAQQTPSAHTAGHSVAASGEIHTAILQEPVRLRNQWQNHLFIGLFSPSDLKVATVNEWDATGWWVLRPVPGTEYVRLWNPRVQGFLHTETLPPVTGSIQDGWWSAMWIIEPVPERAVVRIRNRWREEYLHVERDGSLQFGPVEPSWLSAMWALEPSPDPSEPARTVREPVHRHQILDRGRHHYVTIQTGRRDGAGTDANIYIQLRGTRGDSRDFLLDKPNYDDFERGDRDTYHLGEFDIGTLTHVALRNDGANSGADWFVEWVCISGDERTCHSDGRITISDWLRGRAATMWLPVP
jgi:hypothetical protein